MMVKCPECSGNDRYEGFAIDLLNRISKVNTGGQSEGLNNIYRRMSPDLPTGTSQHNGRVGGFQIFILKYLNLNSLVTVLMTRPSN